MDIATALQIIAPRGTSEGDLKVAYKALAKRHHPDVSPGGGDKMKVINGAMDLLKKNLGAWNPLTAADVEAVIRQGVFDRCKHFAKITFGDGKKTYSGGVPVPPLESQGKYEVDHLSTEQIGNFHYKHDRERNVIRIYEGEVEVSNFFAPPRTVLQAVLNNK